MEQIKGNNPSENSDLQAPTDRSIYNKFFLIIAYVAPVLTFKEGTVQTIATLIVLSALLMLFFTDDFYLLLPPLIFFYVYLILPGGVALFRVYSILMIIKVLNKKINIDLKTFLPFAVIVLHSVFIIMPVNIKLAVFVIFDMVFLILYSRVYLSNIVCFDMFFRLYVISAVFATIFGVLRIPSQINTAVLVDGNWVYITRFIATYNDPNYLGFFLNIAIFAALILKLFPNRLFQYAVTIILYLALIATLSTTAILCNCLGVAIYLVISKKINFKTIIVVIIIIIILVFLYQIALERDVPVLSDAAMKIKSRFIEIEDKDSSSFTTNRSDIWDLHMKYYFKQSYIKMLLGGNLINNYVYDMQKFDTMSHQELIDMLLNFGLIGTTVIMLSFLAGVLKIIGSLQLRIEGRDILMLTIKFTWFFYALGLTLFPGWMFYLFFFI